MRQIVSSPIVSLLVASALVAALAYAVFGLLATPAAASGLPAAEQPLAARLQATDTPTETETPTASETLTLSDTLTPSETLTASQTPSPSHTPSPSATATPTANLLARWSFDEGSGSTAGDTQGAQNNNGTISGATWTDYGLSGKALLFDGSNDYVSVADSADLKPANGFSVGGWIYPLSVGGSVKTIVIKSTAQDYILRTTADGYLEFWAHDLNPKNVTGPVPPLNTWTHVMGVYDKPANQIRLYVNGVLVAAQTVTGTAAYDTGALRIGANHSAAQAWHGRLDEITLWDRAFTTAEIFSLYQSQPTPTPSPTITPSTSLTPSLIPSITSTPSLALTPSITPTFPDYGLWGSGNDGNVTISSTTNIHQVNSIAGRNCTDGGDAVAYNVLDLSDTTTKLETIPAAGCLAVGDEILLINLRGTTSNYANVGKYELLRIYSISADTVTFVTPKQNFYGSGAQNDFDIGISNGEQRVVIQRVPNYANLTITGTLTTSEWNTFKYGLVAFKVSGELTGTGSIVANQVGYRGGIGGYIQSGLGIHRHGGEQGESYSGPGIVSTARNGGGGGGGVLSAPHYAGSGGYGAVGASGNVTGGGVYGGATVSQLFLGSGGGGTEHYGSPSYGGFGGHGGGLILILAKEIHFSGSIQAKGSNGTCGTLHTGGNWVTQTAFRGGGGSGGTIRIESEDVSLGTLSAIGGLDCQGYAGGAVGRIAIYSDGTLSYSSSNPLPYGEALTPTSTPTIAPIDPWGTGNDGDLVVSSNFNINTQNSTEGRVCTDGGDAVAYSIIELEDTYATLSTSPSSGCLKSGDEILLINLQGTGSNYANVGNYEFLRIEVATDNTVVFSTAKLQLYGNDGGDENIGLAASNHRVMLMRVPNYNSVTITSNLSPHIWNGELYGVLAFKVKTILSGTGTLNVSGSGYRGGIGGYLQSGLGINRSAVQGESYKGLGISSTSANGGGGGGNTAYDGAGGGYGLPGANSVYTPMNHGGNIYGQASLDDLFYGSGGGGGQWGGSPSYGGFGGAGGGVILIKANQINFAGQIRSNGANGTCGTLHTGGGWVTQGHLRGGGGSGGSIRLEANAISLSGTVTATGGSNCVYPNIGSVGRIAFFASESLTYATVSPAPFVPNVTPTPTPTPTPTDTPTPPAPVGWQNWEYSYGSQQPHAPSGVIYATPTP